MRNQNDFTFAFYYHKKLEAQAIMYPCFTMKLKSTRKKIFLTKP